MFTCRCLRKFFVALPVFSMFTICSVASWAADWEVTPKVTATGEYNDNILWSGDGQEVEDFIYYAYPEVEAKYSTQRFRAALNTLISVESYADETQLNTVDQDYKLSTSYGISKTLQGRLRGYYRKDTTQETERVEEGLLVDRVDREKYGSGVGFNYDFTPIFGFSTDWNHRWNRYESTYDDRQSDEFLLSPEYILNPKTKLSLDMSYTDTEYDRPGDPSIVNYRIRPSVRYDFEKDWYVIGKAGYRYTEDKTVDPDKNSDGFDFLVDFHKSWKRAQMDFITSREQYSTVDEASLEKTRFTLSGRYNWTERFFTGLSGSYHMNRPDTGTNDYDYYTVSPSLGYKITQTVTLKGAAYFSEYNYDQDSNLDREQFRATLSIDIAWPRLLSGS